ncbi:ComF family protein [Candidatus Leptofilum sp.]|uniref:ComF family protein n=1 Tax=Candidatus Leptofilum sp. TaxID=3241576 RepID=UPI003B5B91E4
MTEKTQLPALTWRSRARGLADSLLNFVFPPVCGACKKAGSLLCEACRAQIQWVRTPLCNRCGRPVPRATDCCSTCQERPLPLNQIRAAVLFAHPASKLIHNLKYNGAFGLSKPLAQLMADAWAEWRMSIDLVLPIPLHAERERKRGYNQSTLLTRNFCRFVGLPFTEDGLKRTRFTTPQVGLTAVERLKNVQDAFATQVDVVGKHILLIDDVCTTGATMAAAATTLLIDGAKSVSGYCVARAI